MTTIGAIYAGLSKEQQRLLNYAHEHTISQFIKLDGGKYIGVHVKNIRNLKPAIETGAWSYGDIA